MKFRNFTLTKIKNISNITKTQTLMLKRNIKNKNEKAQQNY